MVFCKIYILISNRYIFGTIILKEVPNGSEYKMCCTHRSTQGLRRKYDLSLRHVMTKVYDESM